MKFEIEDFKKILKESLKEETADRLPVLSHVDCGPLSRREIRKTKKGGFVWHCGVCGETRFFYDLKTAQCPHDVQIKRTKNGFLTYFCPLCQLRVFMKPKNENLEGGDENGK